MSICIQQLWIRYPTIFRQKYLQLEESDYVLLYLRVHNFIAIIARCAMMAIWLPLATISNQIYRPKGLGQTSKVKFTQGFFEKADCSNKLLIAQYIKYLRPNRFEKKLLCYSRALIKQDFSVYRKDSGRTESQSSSGTGLSEPKPSLLLVPASSSRILINSSV